MKNRKWSSLLLSLAVLVLLANGMTFGADNGKADQGLVKQRPEQVKIKTPSPYATPANLGDMAGLYTIYSNLGPQNDVYDDTNGWIVRGANTGFGRLQWVAMPFIPTANAEVTGIAIAVGYSGGAPNAVVIGLAGSDSVGLPGKSIHTWNVNNLPTFGSCCQLVVVKDNAGLPVVKGNQYWVVAATNTNEDDTSDAWAFTYNDAQGWFAFTHDYGWGFGYGTTPAVGVFGKQTE